MIYQAYHYPHNPLSHKLVITISKYFPFAKSGVARNEVTCLSLSVVDCDLNCIASIPSLPKNISERAMVKHLSLENFNKRTGQLKISTVVLLFGWLKKAASFEVCEGVTILEKWKHFTKAYITQIEGELGSNQHFFDNQCQGYFVFNEELEKTDKRAGTSCAFCLKREQLYEYAMRRRTGRKDSIDLGGHINIR